MNIGENIKNFRTFRGILQQELADKLGKSKSVISNWERGENSPDVESCERLCQILDVTPNQLFGWEKNTEYMLWVEKQARMRMKLQQMAQQKEDLEKRIAAYTAALNKVTNDIDVDDLEEQED